MYASPADYCPRCGRELDGTAVNGRTRPYCTRCEEPVFEAPAVAAGVAAFDRDGRLLLVERGREPHAGDWMIPGGYVEPDEYPRAAARREFEEETGLTAVDLDLGLETIHHLSAGGRPIVSVAYTARIDPGRSPVAGDDAASARFWSRESVAAADPDLRPQTADLVERLL